MNKIMSGTVWTCGDNVSTYQIIAKKRWTLTGVDQEVLGKWAFEEVVEGIENVPFGFRELGYSVIVAGHDFCGGGKSIEHPIAAMQGANVQLILAESFSRYGFRNAINRALPVITCPGISQVFKTGDQLEANLSTGEIRNLSTGQRISGIPLPDHILKLISAGGLLKYCCGILQQKNG